VPAARGCAPRRREHVAPVDRVAFVARPVVTRPRLASRATPRGALFYPCVVDMSDRQTDEGPEVALARRIANAAPGRAREAEADLYRLLAPRARRYGLRHLRDADAAADLMQQAMTLTIERLRSGGLREPERVVSFLLGTCRLMVMDQRRGERRRADLLERFADAVPMADLDVAPRLDQQRVADCLDRLPERERTVLVLSFYDDQSSSAVGAQLGLSAGNVRVIRHRGVEKLRRCVDAGRRETV
jgi:RNA polymerase sigma-70 factor (ECF subfamily)